MLHDGAPPAPSFFCPLTMAIMKDPVQDREGGYNHEFQSVCSLGYCGIFDHRRISCLIHSLLHP